MNDETRDLVFESRHPLPEVAEMLDVRIVTVRRWIKKGLMVAHRVGKKLVVYELDLNAFLNRRA